MNPPYLAIDYTLKITGVLFFLVGCAAQKPEALPNPREYSCFDIPKPILSKEKYGLLDIEWETRLERGPYYSEKEDKEGTYFRGPPGGVFLGQPAAASKPSGPLTHMTHDGGIFIPRDPNAAPRIYYYFSTADAPVEIPSEDVTCSSILYAKDPSTQKVSIAAFSAAGAAGGAVGGTIGRSVSSGSNLSYGQAAVAGGVGGAIGGAIVGGLINMDVGKIVPGTPIKDAVFANKIKEFSNKKIPLKEMPKQLGVSTNN